MSLIDDRYQFFSFSLTSVASDVFKICLATKCFPPGKARPRHFPAERYFSRLPESFDKGVACGGGGGMRICCLLAKALGAVDIRNFLIIDILR